MTQWTDDDDGGTVVDDSRQRAAMREAIGVATKASLISVALGSAAVAIALYLLRDAITAAQQVKDMRDSAGPALLLTLLGVGVGSLIGWRIASSAGLVGPAAWLIGVVGVAIVTAVAIVAAFALFPAGVPTMCWISIGVMVIGALPAVSYFCLWAG